LAETAPTARMHNIYYWQKPLTSIHPGQCFMLNYLYETSGEKQFDLALGKWGADVYRPFLRNFYAKYPQGIPDTLFISQWRFQ